MSKTYTNQDNYENDNQGYNIENSLAASTPFNYNELDAEPRETVFDVDSQQILIRFASLIFSSHKPKVTLAALLYASGVDVGIYLNVENTETAIATALGESKQNFSISVKKLKQEFNLRSNTGKQEETRQAYTRSNVRKTKTND